MSGDEADSRDATALSFGKGHGGRCTGGFFRGSMMIIRESSQVGGLGLMMESDIAHGPRVLVCFSGVARNLRHHSRPVWNTAFSSSIPQLGKHRYEPRAINSNAIFPETLMRLWNWEISKRAMNVPISFAVVSCTST